MRKILDKLWKLLHNNPIIANYCDYRIKRIKNFYFVNYAVKFLKIKK